MQVSLENIPERKLSPPPNIIEKRIDTGSGLLTESGGRMEYFINGTEPKRSYVEEQGYYIPSDEINENSQSKNGKNFSKTDRTFKTLFHSNSVLCKPRIQ